ncbi:MAG: ABC transporter permease subunit [Candidatus Hydrogenedentes bacterium]|nr:ABC transporter permease subunit [Candidatus Hydrogenedentota bacterium]
MRNTWAICKREFKAFFLTPIGYVVTGLVAVISGLAFSLQFLEYVRISQDPTANAFSSVPDFEEWLLSPFLLFCGTLIMFLSPLITMRLFAEERHRGTIELLLTHPLRDREIIFGKYAAALGMVLVLLLIVLVDLGIVFYFAEVEVAVLMFGLCTVFLMGAAFISMGLFISALTRNQITSGSLTFGASLLLFIVGTLGEDLPETNPAPGDWPQMLRTAAGFLHGVLRRLLLEVRLDAHARDMAQGIFQPQDVAYYVLFCAFFLFLTFRALESRHWRS